MHIILYLHSARSEVEARVRETPRIPHNLRGLSEFISVATELVEEEEFKTDGVEKVRKGYICIILRFQNGVRSVVVIK
jgi:hypothetical protein